MKTGIVTCSLALAAFALAGQSTVRLTGRLHVGEDDRYKIHFSGSAIFGDLDVSQTKEEKVVKLYESGGADILTTLLSRQILVNGSKISQPLDPPSTTRVDKNGVPLEPKDQVSGGDQFRVCLTSLFDRDLRVGDVVQVNRTNPDNKGKTTGFFKIVSLDDGEVRAAAALQITRGNEMPTHFKGTFLVHVADARLDKIDGSAEQFDIGEGHSLDEAHYTLERVHS